MCVVFADGGNVIPVHSLSEVHLQHGGEEGRLEMHIDGYEEQGEDEEQQQQV